MVNKLHGHIKLKLYNTFSGNLEKVIEGDNIITNAVPDILKELDEKTQIEEKIELEGAALENRIAVLEKQMKKAAENLDFEQAIELRNQITRLQKGAIGI